MGKKSGMTLIEIMAMVAICSFIFLGIGRWLAISSRIHTRAATQAKAQEYLDIIEAALRRVDIIYVQSYLGENGDTTLGQNLGDGYLHNLSFFVEYGSYGFPYASSPIRTTLEALMEKGKAMGNFSFNVQMFPQIRTTSWVGHARATYGAGQAAAGELVDWGQDWVRSHEYFRDRYGLFDRDGDLRLHSYYLNSEGRMTSEMPDTDVKRVVILVGPYGSYKKIDRSAALASRTIYIRRQELGTDESATAKSLLSLVISKPAVGKYLTSRKLAEERAAYDLTVPYPCPALDVYRIDQYNDPVLGAGTFKITGRTAPNATVKLYGYAVTPLLDSFPVGGDGRFTDKPLPGLTAWFNNGPNDRFGRSSTGGVFQAQVGSAKSALTSIMWPHQEPGFVRAQGVHPPDGFVARTLSPLTGIQTGGAYDAGREPTCSAMYVNGAPQTLGALASVVHGWVAGAGSRFPAILSDNTTYSVVEQLRNYSGYKSSGAWSFQVDLGTPGPSDFDDTPPVFTNLIPAPGSTVTSNNVSIIADMADPESGIDYRSVQVYVNGVPKIDVGAGLEANRVYLTTSTSRAVYLNLHISLSPGTTYAVEVKAKHWSNDPPGAREGSATWTFSKP